MRVGLTGGIGCGKTAAAACFGRLGFRIVSADRLAHEVLLAPEVLRQIQQRWGDEVLLENGLPDRKFIAARVFSHPSEREWLEGLVHPRVAAAWRGAIKDDSVDWLVEIPLLFEKGWEKEFDHTISVTCSRPQQLARLKERGWSEAELLAREAAQLPLAEKTRRASHELKNDGSVTELGAKVESLVGQWRSTRR